MKVGYPCINNSIGCRADKTIRAKFYNKEKHIEVIENNLNCLQKILEFNVKNNLFFHRISSETIPLATHPISEVDWKTMFKDKIVEIGSYIKKHQIRISMHPDHFVVLNSPKESTVNNSVEELAWHCDFLDLLGLDDTAKVQIHIGGVYGNKQQAIQRFIQRYKKLPNKVKRRLAIENDDYKFNVQDALQISKSCQVPIIFDTLHHECNNEGEDMIDALNQCKDTWKEKDGLPMVDYSTQQEGERKGKHAETINISNYINFKERAKNVEFDVMLEIKDKEVSALKAISKE